MTGIISLRERLHNKVLLVRKVEYMVNQHRFEELWGESSEKEKEAARTYIESLDASALSEWINKHPSLDVSGMSIRQLYARAKRLGIRNYSRQSKLELIAAIQRIENDERKTASRDQQDGGRDAGVSHPHQGDRRLPTYPGGCLGASSGGDAG